MADGSEPSVPALARSDYLILAVVCLLVFGYALVGGRPLTMHEGVLPQSAREMLHDRDWIVPKSGGRPWIERPPLPQWLTVVAYTVFGVDNSVAVARLLPALLGTFVVLLTARMASAWFGRWVGLLSGLMFATMFELVSYAWLAEADIFLCAIVTAAVAIWVEAEYIRSSSRTVNDMSFLGQRPPFIIAFFILMGMTNLAKGLLFGSVMAAAPIAAFMILNRDLNRIRRYVWLWGWVAFAAIAIAWPIAVALRVSDAVELWKYDHFGRLSGSYTAINEPVWYYLPTILWETAPWTIFALIGLVVVVKSAAKERSSPALFLACWSLVPIAVFTLASGKHHHYLLQCLAPWGILAALGATRAWVWIAASARARRVSVWIVSLGVGVPAAAVLLVFRDFIAGPPWVPVFMAIAVPMFIGAFAMGLKRLQPNWVVATTLATTIAGYWWVHSCVLPPRDQCLADTAFIHEVAATVPSESTLAVNADLQSMDVFRILFYLGGAPRALHNLKYLRDARFNEDEIYIIAKAKDAAELAAVGKALIVLQSERSRRETGPADRLTLFHLRFHPGLERTPMRRQITAMEAMSRK